MELAWRPNRLGRARMGVVVPRFQHSAVDRNRLQRRLREILRRETRAALPPVDLVVRARRDAYDAPFAVLRAELTGAAARLA